MIVDPDFLDHWRTGMVRDALGDQMAPVYILRLWAHCQERKSDTFVMPTKGLKAQCKFQGDADAFEAALIDAGFLERDGSTLRVLGWAEKNASLIAAWENGSKGGRPKKEPNENPRETEGKPSGNQAVTHGQPNENPPLTQAKPIREDKRREESNQTTSNEVAVSNSVTEQLMLQVEDKDFHVISATPIPPACPHQEIINIYHEILPMGTYVRNWRGTRAKHLQARWREDPKRQTIEWWRRFFEYAGKSDFLTSKVPPANGKDVFVVRLDWLITPSNFDKVIEGFYHREKSS